MSPLRSVPEALNHSKSRLRMLHQKDVASSLKKQDKLYVTLCIAFSGLLIVSNMVYQKFINLTLFGVHVGDISAGTLTYPLTFVITDLITELYGKNHAKFCLAMAIGLNCAVAIIMAILDVLPATGWSKVSQEIFHTTFGHYSFAIGASLIASYFAQRVDISIYATLKRGASSTYLLGGVFSRFLISRAFISSSLALMVDSVVVVSLLTLMGILPSAQFLSILSGSWLFKLIFTALNGPIFYGAVKILRRYTSSQEV